MRLFLCGGVSHAGEADRHAAVKRQFVSKHKQTAIVPLLLLALILLACTQAERGAKLPELTSADYAWIALRIYQNEAHGEARYLTHWNAGEDFPSMGIGHFIWFPVGVDAPFDETFPALVEFLKANKSDCAPIPTWLDELHPVKAPWPDKVAFDAALTSSETASLRSWLAATASTQAHFIVASFERRWNELGLVVGEKGHLDDLLQQLVSTPQGMYAVIDYFNFKGMGTNPRERYDGQGWGLVQVLQRVASQQQSGDTPLDLLRRFSEAAADRLSNRIALSPTERNEERWRAGWMRRVAEYQQGTPESNENREIGFRVLPYVQNPTPTSITIMWFSDSDTTGEVSIRLLNDGQSTDAGVEYEMTRESPAQPACALNYHPSELELLNAGRLPIAPMRHEVSLQGLLPAETYQYEVVQNGKRAGGQFHLPADSGGEDEAVRFIVYGDSETEPESTGKHSPWGGSGDAVGAHNYRVDQSTGYKENLRAIINSEPDFVAIAGDLVESGGEQRDWDEFWRLNAGLAANTAIFPALGNHDYYGGPGELGGYGNDASRRASNKYKTYFSLPENGSDVVHHQEAYYSVRWGPATLIVIDGNDGAPHRSESDSNWYMLDENQGGNAPVWNPGSTQFKWLEQALREAQQTSQFTFVMLHMAPYSSGVHGLPPGQGEGVDPLSGRPLRALLPMFMKYGVDAVFSGHDELYEHSVVSGQEQWPNGSLEDHKIHFLVVGTGGDGLRDAAEGAKNAFRTFSVHENAPEIYNKNGMLVDGGQHYGHVEVNIKPDTNGQLRARLEPVYIFPLLDADGAVHGFERRVYDDVTVIIAHTNDKAASE